MLPLVPDLDFVTHSDTIFYLTFSLSGSHIETNLHEEQKMQAERIKRVIKKHPSVIRSQSPF